MAKKEIQKKYLEFKLLDQHIKQIQQQLSMLEQQILELNTLNENLDEIKNIKEKTEILFPLGSGLFGKANLKDNKEILINVGAGVVVKKTIQEAKEIITKQIKQMEELTNQMMDNLQKAALQAQILQEDIENLSQKE